MTSEICLSCIISYPDHNKFKIDMATESEEVFDGVFEFSVQEKVERPFAQRQFMVLKPEQEAAIRD